MFGSSELKIIKVLFTIETDKETNEKQCTDTHNLRDIFWGTKSLTLTPEVQERHLTWRGPLYHVTSQLLRFSW